MPFALAALQFGDRLIGAAYISFEEIRGAPHPHNNTWTALRQDGPNHLGCWQIALP